MKRILFVIVLVTAVALGYWHAPKTELASLHPDFHPTAAASAPSPMVAPAQPPRAEQVTPPPAKPAAVAPSPVITAVDAPQKADLANRVAQAQRAAVAKYPSLAIAGSEINSRFVFRYKRLLDEHSPRLQDPTWPTQLADECADATGIKAAVPVAGSRPAAAASH